MKLESRPWSQTEKQNNFASESESICLTLNRKKSTSARRQHEWQIQLWAFGVLEHRIIGLTLPKTNIAPENGPSQKESSLPPLFFRDYVRFRACNCNQFFLMFKQKKPLELKSSEINLSFARCWCVSICIFGRAFVSEKAYPLGDLRIPPEIAAHCMLSCHRAWFGNPKSLINGLAQSGNRYHV